MLCGGGVKVVLRWVEEVDDLLVELGCVGCLRVIKDI